MAGQGEGAGVKKEDVLICFDTFSCVLVTTSWYVLISLGTCWYVLVRLGKSCYPTYETLEVPEKFPPPKFLYPWFDPGMIEGERKQVEEDIVHEIEMAKTISSCGENEPRGCIKAKWSRSAMGHQRAWGILNTCRRANEFLRSCVE